MESANGGLMAGASESRVTATLNESHLFGSSKKLVSSASLSSASSSDSEDPFEDDSDRLSISYMSNDIGPDHERYDQGTSSALVLPDQHLGSSMSLQPPAAQSMGHSSDVSPSPYRIPSSVFSRSSNTPTEWSVASNESLFSIQMGNMSFTRDFVQYLGKSGELKSGELGLYRKSGELSMYKKSRELSMYKKSGDVSMYQKSGELGTVTKPAEHNKALQHGVYNVHEEPTDMRPTTTGQMMNLSYCPQSAYQACPNSGPGVSATEAAAAETMKEVIIEQSRSESQLPSKNNGARSPTGSADDGGSVQPFAFPAYSSDSVESRSGDISLRPPKSSRHPQQPPVSLPQIPPKGKSSETPTSSAAAVPAVATGWFSFFSYCWPCRS